MERKTVLEDWHPLVLLLYLACIMGLDMWEKNMAISLAALVGSLAFLALIEDGRTFRRRVGWMVALILFTTMINPVFSHNGRTALFFVNGQAVTLEAVIFGCYAGVKVAGVFGWFGVWNRVLDSDKQLYLFSRLSPSFGLLISMILRVVPEMKREYLAMKEAADHLNPAKPGWIDRLRLHLKLFLGVAGWIMEHMLHVAASMRARGYGRGKRTSFSLYHFGRRDGLTVAGMLAGFAFLLFLMIRMVPAAYYYPAWKLPLTTYSYLYYGGTALFALWPVAREGWDRIQWHIYRSRI